MLHKEEILFSKEECDKIISYMEMGIDDIIPVDFAGYPVAMDDFRFLAEKYNLWIMEDACHAPGGYFKDSQNDKQKCGNSKFADFAIFSFFPFKSLYAL